MRCLHTLLLVTMLTASGCRRTGHHSDASALAVATPNVEVSGPNDGTVSFQNGFGPVVDRVAPTVVNVSSTRIVHPPSPEELPFFSDPLFREFFGGGRAPKPPHELRQQSLGSGVLISKDGYVLTNNHVIQGSSDIRVALRDGRELKAKVVGADPKTDIALLRIPGDDYPVVQFGDSSKVRVGAFAIAFGEPLGLGHTVTVGIISAKGRGNVGIADYEDFLQTDAAINPGNSGGPLVNVDGELIGINTAIATTGGGQGNQGIGFAVPSNLAREVVKQIEAHGHVIRGWLGVSVQDVTPSIAQAMDLKTSAGALIGDVQKESPAARAGLRRGDVVVDVNGTPVKDAGALRMIIAETDPGKQVTLGVLRGNKRIDLVCTLGEMPTERQAAPNAKPEGAGPLGAMMAPLTPDLQTKLGVPEGTTGAVVVRVKPGSRAAEAGLQPGDVIQEVDRTPIRGPEDLKQALSKNPKQAHLLLVRHGQETHYVAIPAEEGNNGG